MDRPIKIGLLGGSFDPVHCGHMAMAEAATTALGLDQVRFIPCHRPPHKPGFLASDEARVAMLEGAIASREHYVIDRRELDAERVSYTIDTLSDIRAEEGPDAVLVFMLGWDSWLNLEKWRSWQRLFRFSNIAVFKRPGSEGEPSHSSWTAPLELDSGRLAQQSCGFWAEIEMSPQDISSTGIRQLEINEKSTSIHLGVPPNVVEYIKTHRLYR